MSPDKRLTIISGGQSGVDRAALDAAIAFGLPYGGWCPLGGWAEDFPDPPGVLALYPHLRQTPERDPAERTAWNVRDADALLLLAGAEGLAVSAGTRLALDCAEQYGKPHLVLDVDDPAALTLGAAWLTKLKDGGALCIGGPRESEAPGIYAAARALLEGLLGAQ